METLQQLREEAQRIQKHLIFCPSIEYPAWVQELERLEGLICLAQRGMAPKGLEGFSLGNDEDRLILADLLYDLGREADSLKCRDLKLPIKWDSGKLVLYTDPFTDGYISTGILESFHRASPRPAQPWTIEDISPKTLEEIVKDCREFQEIHAKEFSKGGAVALKAAGRSFWLVRNGWGNGFSGLDWGQNNELEYSAMMWGRYRFLPNSEGKLDGFRLED